MGENRGLWARRKESTLGNRTPKRHPSKFVPWILWIDWPYFGPTGAKSLRPYVKSARRKEASPSVGQGGGGLTSLNEATCFSAQVLHFR